MFRWFIACLVLLATFDAHAELNPIDAMIIPGEVIKGHAKVEAKCSSCHKAFKRAKQNVLCLDCHDHKKIAEDVRKKTGYHGRLQDHACSECHTDHKGRNAKIVNLNSKTFNHKWTDFPLTGAHKKSEVKCKDCHRRGQSHRKAPSNCYSCHRKDDTHKGSFGKECQSCHVTANWKKVKFDHRKTDYPLIGKHKTVKCKSCHKNKDHKKTPKKCYSCHRKDDEHKGFFGRKCESCHTAKDWNRSTYNHARKAGFPLRGKHKRIKCTACHKKPVEKDKLGKTCYSCHRSDDVHKGQEGKKCESCHKERSWRRTVFDHGLTAFPLLGKHAKVKCKKCHRKKTFRDAPVACVGCHKKDDDHKGKLGNKCETCHGVRSWRDWRFNHNKQTNFRLRGKHKKIKCTGCHTERMKTISLPGSCNDCHDRDDVHDGSFGLFCERCHVDSSWGRVKNLRSLPR